MAHIAGAQAGIVARQQLLDAGLSPAQVRSRLHRHLLVEVHRGVYRFGACGGPHAEEIAALLTRPIGALVGGLRAAGLYGWRPPPDGVDLLVSGRAGHAHRAGIRVKRTTYPDLLEPGWVDGVPVVLPAVAVLQCANELGERALEQLVDEAITSGRVNHGELVAAARNHPDHPGAGRLAEQLRHRAVGNPTGSPGQEALLAFARTARLPDPHMDASIGGGFTADLFWPDVRVALEYDSYRYHSTKAKWLRDRRKQTYCRDNGIVLVRADDADLAEHGLRPIAQVAAAIAARSVMASSAYSR